MEYYLPNKRMWNIGCRYAKTKTTTNGHNLPPSKTNQKHFLLYITTISKPEIHRNKGRMEYQISEYSSTFHPPPPPHLNRDNKRQNYTGGWGWGGCNRIVCDMVWITHNSGTLIKNMTVLSEKVDYVMSNIRFTFRRGHKV